jgi:hypothetical protein
MVSALFNSTVAVSLMSLGGLAGESSWLTNGVPISDVPWAKSTNGFGASLHVLGDRTLVDRWYTPDTPVIKDVEVASRGKTNYVVIMFSGASRDARGRCDIRDDIDLVGPHGDSQRLALDAVGWQGEKIVSTEKLQLGMTHAYLVFTNAGEKYSIRATVRDRIGHVALTLSRDVRVQTLLHAP